MSAKQLTTPAVKPYRFWPTPIISCPKHSQSTNPNYCEFCGVAKTQYVDSPSDLPSIEGHVLPIIFGSEWDFAGFYCAE